MLGEIVLPSNLVSGGCAAEPLIRDAPDDWFVVNIMDLAEIIGTADTLAALGQYLVEQFGVDENAEVE